MLDAHFCNDQEGCLDQTEICCTIRSGACRNIFYARKRYEYFTDSPSAIQCCNKIPIDAINIGTSLQAYKLGFLGNGRSLIQARYKPHGFVSPTSPYIWRIASRYRRAEVEE